jgi:hypothetical protein
MAVPAYSLNRDSTRLRVEFPTEPAVGIELDADEVDDLIAHLAEMRAAMKPPVAMADPDPGTRVKFATAGRFYVQPRPAERDLVIAFLHPGLRWVGMLFGRKEAEHLIDTIRDHLPAPS